MVRGRKVEECECGNRKDRPGEGCERCRALSRRFYLGVDEAKYIPSGPNSLHMSNLDRPLGYLMRGWDLHHNSEDPAHVGRTLTNLIDMLEDMDFSDA